MDQFILRYYTLLYGHVHKKVALEIDFSLPKMCVAF